MSSFTSDAESVSMGALLSVVMVEPRPERRTPMARLFSGPQSRIAREFDYYPGVDELAQVVTNEHGVVFVDLDHNSEKALDVIEAVCAADTGTTAIVYSERIDPELLVRYMRAGAREFLTEPVLPSAVAEALVRASVRRDEVRRVRKVLGKLFVFVGAKGSCGATTIATNFAVSLARNGCSTALVDLDLHLGDAAISLGVAPKFSVVDALDNLNRLDSEFLSVMLAKHESGLSVLAAPDRVTPEAQGLVGGMDYLVRLSRENFSYVVVDAGTKPSVSWENLFEAATTIYLVTQISVPELRNANRLIGRYFATSHQDKWEVVLNRVVLRNSEIDEAGVTKALTRPPRWKLPNDYGSARKAQNTAIPLVMEDSPLARSIREMACSASGYNQNFAKKKRFGLFG